MTSIQILPKDTTAASTSLARLQQQHGAPRTLELAAAQIRADASYLARWTGPSAAAEVLAQEAHRIVTEAAAELAAPGAEAKRSAHRGRRRRLLSVGRVAAWSVGTVTGLVLGLGISALALG